MPECVQCGRPLPPLSKLTSSSVPAEEAKAKSWTGTANADGTVAVRMCMQCQIDRSEKKKAAGRAH